MKHEKADLHDYLKKNPRSIKVYISPYPDLIPAVSSKSKAGKTLADYKAAKH